MKNENLDMELGAFDYSQFSAVKESLLQTLLKKHRQDNFNGFKSLAQKLSEARMLEEELDYVAAAGTSIPEKVTYTPKKK